jgi:hypothetical protein
MESRRDRDRGELLERRSPGGPAATAEVMLPVVLEDHRWFLQTTTATAHRSGIYLDSAGGMFRTRTAVQRLQLPVRHMHEKGEGRLRPDIVSRARRPGIPAPRLDPFPAFDQALGSETACSARRGSRPSRSPSTIRGSN